MAIFKKFGIIYRVQLDKHFAEFLAEVLQVVMWEFNLLHPDWPAAAIVCSCSRSVCSRSITDNLPGP